MKKVFTRITVVAVAVLALAVLPLLQARPVSAATPSDDCFNFFAGVIYDYYDNEGMDSANPACPRDVEIPATIGGEAVTTIEGGAFANKQLTSIVTPVSVVSIKSAAFTNNRLASATILGPVSVIESSVFANNQLTSIVIPSSVTTIEYQAFAANKLNAVVIPDSVATIDPEAFVYQNAAGGDFFDLGSSPDTVWYAQLYANNPSARGLQDQLVIFSESEGGWDYNGDGDMTDVFSFGGYLINPARVEVSYKSAQGAALLPAVTITGTGLSSYMAAENETNDPSLYLRVGDTQSIEAPSIDGYGVVTPVSPHLVTLTAATNPVDFIYSNPNSSTGSTEANPQAPNTGVNPHFAAYAVAAVIASIVVLLAGAAKLVLVKLR